MLKTFLSSRFTVAKPRCQAWRLQNISPPTFPSFLLCFRLPLFYISFSSPPLWAFILFSTRAPQSLGLSPRVGSPANQHLMFQPAASITQFQGSTYVSGSNIAQLQDCWANCQTVLETVFEERSVDIVLRWQVQPNWVFFFQTTKVFFFSAVGPSPTCQLQLLHPHTCSVQGVSIFNGSTNQFLLWST